MSCITIVDGLPSYKDRDHAADILSKEFPGISERKSYLLKMGITERYLREVSITPESLKAWYHRTALLVHPDHIATDARSNPKWVKAMQACGEIYTYFRSNTSASLKTVTAKDMAERQEEIKRSNQRAWNEAQDHKAAEYLELKEKHGAQGDADYEAMDSEILDLRDQREALNRAWKEVKEAEDATLEDIELYTCQGDLDRAYQEERQWIELKKQCQSILEELQKIDDHRQQKISEKMSRKRWDLICQERDLLGSEQAYLRSVPSAASSDASSRWYPSNLQTPVYIPKVELKPWKRTLLKVLADATSENIKQLKELENLKQNRISEGGSSSHNENWNPAEQDQALESLKVKAQNHALIKACLRVDAQEHRKRIQMAKIEQISVRDITSLKCTPLVEFAPAIPECMEEFDKDSSLSAEQKTAILHEITSEKPGRRNIEKKAKENAVRHAKMRRTWRDRFNKAYSILKDASADGEAKLKARVSLKKILEPWKLRKDKKKVRAIAKPSGKRRGKKRGRAKGKAIIDIPRDCEGELSEGVAGASAAPHPDDGEPDESVEGETICAEPEAPSVYNPEAAQASSTFEEKDTEEIFVDNTVWNSSFSGTINKMLKRDDDKSSHLTNEEYRHIYGCNKARLFDFRAGRMLSSEEYASYGDRGSVRKIMTSEHRQAVIPSKLHAMTPQTKWEPAKWGSRLTKIAPIQNTRGLNPLHPDYETDSGMDSPRIKATPPPRPTVHPAEVLRPSSRQREKKKKLARKWQGYQGSAASSSAGRWEDRDSTDLSHSSSRSPSPSPDSSPCKSTQTKRARNAFD